MCPSNQGASDVEALDGVAATYVGPPITEQPHVHVVKAVASVQLENILVDLYPARVI